MSETKQPLIVQLTPEELAVCKPYFSACDEQVRLFKATIDRAKLLMVEAILAARTAAGVQTADTAADAPEIPTVVQ